MARKTAIGSLLPLLLLILLRSDLSGAAGPSLSILDGACNRSSQGPYLKGYSRVFDAI